MLNSKAHQNPATLKPGTIHEVSIINKALITKVKSPSVKIFIGSDKTSKIGFIKAFNIPITKATSNATTKVETDTPGST